MKHFLIAGLLVTATLTSAGSPPGDVVGKITVGLQAWFATQGDGSPMNQWWHWAQNCCQPPSPSNSAIKSWPDVREYSRTYQTQFGNLNNGNPANLFSSWDEQVLDTQFRWMSEYGIHTAALQRFNPLGGEGPIRDAITARVRTAAERHNVKFYIMYDVSDWINMQQEIKDDWTNKMEQYTSSSAHARQNDMPVVCIWGFGFDDNQRPFTPAQAQDVINWFKARNLYVIGGVPTHWRSGNEDSRPGFFDVYSSFHMISPWMVGRIGNIWDTDNFYNNVNQQDQALLNQHNIDYQPCVLPGDLAEHQRAHGDFMWRQFYNMVRVGAQGIYISMWDEYNESNQIAKTAEDQSWVPNNGNFVTTDEDGVWCTSDYYLRLTRDGGRMLRGELPLTEVRPTQPFSALYDPSNVTAWQHQV